MNGASAPISSARAHGSFGRPPGSGFRCSARSISVSVRRRSGTSELVETASPSVTRVAQAGSGRGEPSTPTTHIRPPPYGSSLSSWQSVGLNTPGRVALPDHLMWRPVRRTRGVEAFGVNAYTAGNAGDEIVEEQDETGDGAGKHE